MDIYTTLRGQLCTLVLLVFALGMLIDVVDLGLGTRLRSWAVVVDAAIMIVVVEIRGVYKGD